MSTTAPTTSLPHPAERPGSDVVIYDGHCRFCTAQVERLDRWDRRERLSFLSLHDALVTERYPDLTHEMLMEEMYVITNDGRRHAGAAAFRYLSRQLPILWPVAPLMHVPLSLPLWRFCYRQVAKHRYRLGGRADCDGDTCQVHFD